MRGDNPRVVKPGRDGQRHRCVKGHEPENDHPLGLGELMQDDDGDRCNLGYGVGLSKDAWTKLPSSGNRIKDGGYKKDANIAPEDQDSDGPWHQALIHKDQKQCAEQQFVRDGIEILAEYGSLFENASQDAIECVSQAGTDKESEAEGVSVFKDCRYQKRRETDTDDGKKIRRRAEWIAPGDGTFGHRVCDADAAT